MRPGGSQSAGKLLKEARAQSLETETVARHLNGTLLLALIQVKGKTRRLLSGNGRARFSGLRKVPTGNSINGKTGSSAFNPLK